MFGRRQVASQQVMTLILDAMRSGIQWAPSRGDESHDSDALAAATVFTSGDALSSRPSSRPDDGAAVGVGGYQRVPTPRKHLDMMMYIMKHWPGNTNKSWKRQLFGDRLIVDQGARVIKPHSIQSSYSLYGAF